MNNYLGSLATSRVLIVGFGRSGQAALRLLEGTGARMSVTDEQPPDRFDPDVCQSHPGVSFSLGGFRADDFTNTDLIVLSPGVPRSLPLLEEAHRRGISVISEVELAFRASRGKFVGVTGSNGKTTTTSLLGQMICAAYPSSKVAGNIGTPLSQAVHESLPDQQVRYIVELSSFQLETIATFRCKVALLLNVTPDHMDRYQGFESYRQAKLNIFSNQTETDFAVWNADDPNSVPNSENLHGNPFPFSRRGILEEGIYTERGWIIARRAGRQTEICPVASVRIPGKHNLENVLAASAGAFLMGVSVPQIRATIEAFRGVEHRIEPVATVDGVDYYNDSKATNVDSAIKALESFDRPVIAIMGGLDKGTDFSPLQAHLRERVKQVFVIGAAASKMLSVMPSETLAERAESLESAVQKAHECAAPGDVVLLVPACASFDMFKNYEHRGTRFKQLVRSLQSGPTSQPSEVAQ